MSILSGYLFSGAARHHIEIQEQHASNKSSAPAKGILAPMLDIARDPVGRLLGRPPPHSQEAADRKQVLYLYMKEAETYEQWAAAATELDELEGNDVWKAEDECPEYHATRLKARLKDLDQARLDCDVRRMLYLVRTTLSRSLAGMSNLKLYKHSHVGTKELIEQYNDSVIRTLEAIPDLVARQGEDSPVRTWDLYDDLARTRQSYGRTALFLSGGGTYGMLHIGVIKALWQLRLLPRIVAGASAGSIVCAILCSKTDEEIPEVLEQFCYGDLAVFGDDDNPESLRSVFMRFSKHGHLYDISHLERVMRSMLGDMTFQECYNRTNRILNIPVSSADKFERSKILNYLTTPHVMIWSAVCASCSVPVLFSAAQLMVKDPETGESKLWADDIDQRWIDGSVDNDIPTARLAEMFNVNHFIVSQVNPHVVPFLEKEEEFFEGNILPPPILSSEAPWVCALRNLTKAEILHRLDQWIELDIFSKHVSFLRSILSQKYSGDITIFPPVRKSNLFKVLSNPTSEYMLDCMLRGEQATWPKVSRIRNQVAVELAIDKALKEAKALLHFSERGNGKGQEELSSSQHQAWQNSHGALPFVRFRDRNPQLAASAALISPTYIRKRQSNTSALRSQPGTHPGRASNRSLDLSKLPSHLRAASSACLAASSPLNTSLYEDADSNNDFDAKPLLSPPTSYQPSRVQPPDLWPANRQQLVPADLSPSPTSTLTDGMQPRPPSSPELRYKRLFHPPPSTTSKFQKNHDSSASTIASANGLYPLSKIPTSRKRSKTVDACPQAGESSGMVPAPAPAPTEVLLVSENRGVEAPPDFVDDEFALRALGSNALRPLTRRDSVGVNGHGEDRDM